jgi:hypothetical protein
VGQRTPRELVSRLWGPGLCAAPGVGIAPHRRGKARVKRCTRKHIRHGGDPQEPIAVRPPGGTSRGGRPLRQPRALDPDLQPSPAPRPPPTINIVPLCASHMPGGRWRMTFSHQISVADQRARLDCGAVSHRPSSSRWSDATRGCGWRPSASGHGRSSGSLGPSADPPEGLGVRTNQGAARRSGPFAIGPPWSNTESGSTPLIWASPSRCSPAGRLAQLVRARASHARGRGFEPLIAHASK